MPLKRSRSSCSKRARRASSPALGPPGGVSGLEIEAAEEGGAGRPRVGEGGTVEMEEEDVAVVEADAPLRSRACRAGTPPHPGASCWPRSPAPPVPSSGSTSCDPIPCVRPSPPPPPPPPPTPAPPPDEPNSAPSFFPSDTLGLKYPLCPARGDPFGAATCDTGATEAEAAEDDAPAERNEVAGEWVRCRVREGGRCGEEVAEGSRPRRGELRAGEGKTRGCVVGGVT